MGYMGTLMNNCSKHKLETFLFLERSIQNGEPVPTAAIRGRFVATAADAAAEYVGEGPEKERTQFRDIVIKYGFDLKP